MWFKVNGKMLFFALIVLLCTIPVISSATVTIQASKDSFVIGKSVAFSGTCTKGSYVNFCIFGSQFPNGQCNEGIGDSALTNGVPVSPNGYWSYTWNPGYSIQPGVYTISVNDMYQSPADTIQVRVEGGAVTIVASGDQSYNVGETLTFSGSCTQGNSVLLVMTGGGLPSTGVTLANIQKNADNTWSYQWTVPSSIGGYTISSGTYTVYAYDSSRQVYGTVFINLITPTSPLSTGTSLYISSSPSGADVYIDGLNQGTTPLTLPDQTAHIRLDLQLGRHQIKLTKTGYNDYSTTITIYEGQTTTVSGTLTPIVQTPITGSLEVTSSPSGASVYVDESYQGITPTTLSGQTTGSHTVRYTKSRYYDFSTTTTVYSGQSTTVIGSLNPIITVPTTAAPPPSQGFGSFNPSGFILLLVFLGVVGVGGYLGYKKMRRSNKTEPPFESSSDIPKVEEIPALQSSLQSTKPAAPQRKQIEQNVCPSCGVALKNSLKFCWNCGSAINPKPLSEQRITQVKTNETEISPSPSRDNEAIKILKLRYAKGEISTEEYQSMLDHLKK